MRMPLTSAAISTTSLLLLNARCLPSLLLGSSLLARPLFSRVPPIRLSNSFFLQSFPFSSSSGSSSSPLPPPSPSLVPGSPIPVEVTSFGPLGASVDVFSSSPPGLLIGRGLILQSALAYHSLSNPPAVIGSRLTGYVSFVHLSPHRSSSSGSPPLLKIDVSLRGVNVDVNGVPLDSVGRIVFDIRRRLKEGDGTMPLGDSSTPFEIEQLMPGVSRARFKKALGELYREKEIEKPGERETRLIAVKAEDLGPSLASMGKGGEERRQDTRSQDEKRRQENARSTPRYGGGGGGGRAQTRPGTERRDANTFEGR